MKLLRPPSCMVERRAQRHARFIRSLSCRLVGEEPDAWDDLRQEALIALWQEYEPLLPGALVHPERERRAMAHRMFRFWRVQYLTALGRSWRLDAPNVDAELPPPIESMLVLWDMIDNHHSHASHHEVLRAA